MFWSSFEWAKIVGKGKMLGIIYIEVQRDFDKSHLQMAIKKI